MLTPDELATLGISGLLTEVERLQQENERLQKALDKISKPIKYMQAEAAIMGAQLDGVMAIQLANDVEYLKGIAKMALEGDNTND